LETLEQPKNSAHEWGKERVFIYHPRRSPLPAGAINHTHFDNHHGNHSVLVELKEW